MLLLLQSAGSYPWKFTTKRVWFHLVSEISGVNQRCPVTAALLFLIPKSFPKEEKSIAFKTDESNIFKQHLHFLRPLCLLFINWSVCRVLECSLPFSSWCQHCYKQITTKYKKLLFWSVSKHFLVIPKSNISITIISHITSCLSISHQGLSIAPCFVLLKLIGWPRLEPLGDVWNCANPGFCVIDEN